MFARDYIADPAAGGLFITNRLWGGSEDISDTRVKDEAFGSTATILVVEDEKIVRDVVIETLRMSGLRVVEAKHGSEALTIYEHSHRSIDLILTDVVMPRMGG